MPTIELTDEEIGIALVLVYNGEIPEFVHDEGIESEYKSLVRKLREHENKEVC